MTITQGVQPAIPHQFVSGKGRAETPNEDDAIAKEVPRNSPPITPSNKPATFPAGADPESPYQPRQDRRGEQISPANAQGVFPTQACLFVANLTNGRSDQELAGEVYELFHGYGRCYVKIRHDKHRMPFAFVQFETIEEAGGALGAAVGLQIDGRPLRVELARCDRTVFLIRHDGNSVTGSEARGALERFGPIEATSRVPQSVSRVPDGALVKFVFFEDSKDALIGMKHDETYQALHPPSTRDRLFKRPFRPRAATTSPQVTTPLYTGQHSPRKADEADARSIFVGNLPPSTPKFQLLNAFSGHGNIVDLAVISKSTPQKGLTATFAFVCFDSTEAADRAANAEPPSILGWDSRVEKKEIGRRRRLPPRLPPVPNNDEEILKVLYRIGIGMGLSDEIAAKILNLEQEREPNRVWVSRSPGSALAMPAYAPAYVPSFRADEYQMGHGLPFTEY